MPVSQATNCFCFVVRDGSAEVYRGLGDPVELAEAVRRFQFQIARGLRPGALESHRGDRLVDDALRSLEDMSPGPPQADQSRPALVVGVADERAPDITTEACRVAEVLGYERPLIGAEATVARVTEAAREARIVHLACHGRFSAPAILTVTGSSPLRT